jgi:carboxypeptidase C (cathepsin A)
MITSHLHRLLLAAAAMALIAQPGHTDEKALTESPAVPAPAQFVTHHQVNVHGTRIAFTATAGETYLYNDKNEPIGSIFSYAYLRDGAAPNKRPVMFLVGGGPGAASFSLNLGFGPWALAPGRLALTAHQQPKATPPFDLVDNPDTLLDAADLVFIDPVGTGYSRILGHGKPVLCWPTVG